MLWYVFTFGFIIGGVVGVLAMCILQMLKDEKPS